MKSSVCSLVGARYQLLTVKLKAQKCRPPSDFSRWPSSYSLRTERIENTVSNSFSVVACCCGIVFTAPLRSSGRLFLLQCSGFQPSCHAMLRIVNCMEVTYPSSDTVCTLTRLSSWKAHIDICTRTCNSILFLGYRASWLQLLTCIQLEKTSDLDLDTCYPARKRKLYVSFQIPSRDFSWFFSVLPSKCQDST